MCQKNNIEGILEKYGMAGAASCPTPMTQSKHNSKFEEESLESPFVYRSLIGAFQYLNSTRPNISFTVNHLSQRLSSPTTLDWKKAKRVLRYLKGTSDLCLHIKPSVDFCLTGFSDAD